jgi:hypothetical protein
MAALHDDPYARPRRERMDADVGLLVEQDET